MPNTMPITRRSTRARVGAALAALAVLALLAGLGVWGAAPAVAQASVSAPVSLSGAPVAPAAPCVLLFGQGRNFDPEQPARNRYWDDANGAFNLAVREPLIAAGLPVVNVVLPVSATDVPGNLQRLAGELKRLGCTRVLETAMFADPASGLLIARLRLYPVIGLLGPQAAGAMPRIGSVGYTQQKEFALEARVMERVNPSVLGRAMGDEAASVLARP